MEKIKTDKNSLRQFGLVMALAFMAGAGTFYLKHKTYLEPALVISFLFLACTFLRPQLLKNVYVIWMKLAWVLSWLMTRVILALIFFLVFTPLSFLLKLLGKDLLDLKIEKDRNTYWTETEKREFRKEDYSRQF